MMVKASKAETEIYALVGRLTIRSGNLDNLMAFALTRLLSPSQMMMQHDLPSIFMFHCSTIEQQQNLLRKVMRYRMSGWLRLHKRKSERRAADYMISMFDAVFALIGKSRWIRNLAAHGFIIEGQDGFKLSYQLFDSYNNQRLAERSKRYSGGLSSAQLRKQLEQIELQNSLLAKTNGCLGLLLGATKFPREFLEQANALAPDLGLRPLRLLDPSEGPPMRGPRRKRASSRVPRP